MRPRGILIQMAARIAAPVVYLGMRGSRGLLEKGDVSMPSKRILPPTLRKSGPTACVHQSGRDLNLSEHAA